jgi:hypothetical protein
MDKGKDIRRRWRGTDRYLSLSVIHTLLYFLPQPQESIKVALVVALEMEKGDLSFLTS